MIYGGYSGILWSSIFAALGYFQQQVAAYSTPGTALTSATGAETLAELAQTMLTTLFNGIEAIDTQNIATTWTQETANLRAIQALSLTLSSGTVLIFDNRADAYGNATLAVKDLVPQPPYNVPSSIASGVPTVPSAGLIDFFSTFDYETRPVGLTNNNLIANAYSIETAFTEVANAILVLQGNYLTQLYDVAVRQASVAGSTANILTACASGDIAAGVGTHNVWNQSVTLPAFTMDSDTLLGAPVTEQIQQDMVLRNLMFTLALQVGTLMLALRQPLAAQIRLTTLLKGENLMDVAARTTGNYADWQAIANLNGLVPPYIGEEAAPGIVTWGQKLLLPTPGASTAAVGTTPSYSINFLGTDLYIGPINGDMPDWTGDFQTISGYANLLWALGRRLQTVQGSLIYEPPYGSRIPPEVGLVQTPETAGHIVAFGKSALLSDPRVASLQRVSAQLRPAGQIDFTADVQPKGFDATRVTLNEVLLPFPGSAG